MATLQEYIEACNYPGRLDEAAVEQHLQKYLAALGIKREVVRIKRGWSIEQYTNLHRTVNAVLDDFGKRRDARAALDALDALGALGARAARAALAALDALDALDARDALGARAARAALAALDALDARAARDALDARAARDALDARAARDALGALDSRAALDARDALQRFAEWCLAISGWWWSWDLSWISTTAFGARQYKNAAVDAWSSPLCDAYVAGCWQLFWTDDTLYWAAKPTVHVDRTNGRRRLHCADGPAVVSDIEDLYFWHGILVPRLVIESPDQITAEMIDAETNQEVRRVMIERYGYERYVGDGKIVHEDGTGRLIKKRNTHGDEIAVVSVVNGSKEPDGTYKHYVLSVPPEMGTACEAVAWTYGMSEQQYAKLQKRT